MPARSRTTAPARNPAIAAAVAGLVLAAASASALAAQAAPADGDTVEEVTITGTSIRGTAPVGANLITVDRDAIVESGAQTTQQILQSVPAVTGFGNAAQGGFGSADASGTYAPTIHGLGASASNGTLVLVDGHRMPLSGLNHTLTDPNSIAPLMIERVEVLPDGASSIYGSDAVAGVINFITRRNFQGFEATGQLGYASGYNSESAGFLWGDTWDKTSLMFSYDYSRRSALSLGDRSFTRADHRAQGGNNFASTACSPATARIGAANFFASPYTGAAYTSANAPCDYTGVADFFPETVRNSILVKATHDVNDRVSLTGDLVYSNEGNTAKISRGTVTATVWGAGATPAGGAGQINPYFQGPPAQTSETVLWDANDLLGPGAENQAGSKTLIFTGGATFKIAGDWEAVFGTSIGSNDSTLLTVGTVCQACALKALNGTVSATGAGAVTALGAANALDVWHGATGNLSSASVLNGLLDSTSFQNTHHTIKDYTLKLDGSVFALPGGEAKLAVGAQAVYYTIAQQVVRSNNQGPASTNSAMNYFNWGRHVTSGYAELYLPIVDAGMGIPGVKALDVNVSGRYDNYSDVGSTSNPKLSVSWKLNDTLALRGNISRSFTAPALTSLGMNGVTAESGYAAAAAGFSGPLTLPASFPGVSALQALNLTGCTTGSTTCTINNGTVTGISVTGPSKDLKPEKGKSWSVGLDFTPTFATGLRASLTLWHVEFNGMVTAPQAAFSAGSTALSSGLVIFPTAATPAQIAALVGSRPQTGALPTNSYFVYFFTQQNALNLFATGIDGQVGYHFSVAANDLSAELSGSYKTKMDQQFGGGGETFSVLNTAGFNTTFPSNRFAGRLDLGVKHSAWNAHLLTNYQGAYTNWNGNAPYGLVRDASFAPIGGGQPIGSNFTFDVRAGYHFGGEGNKDGLDLNLTINNVSDKAPPFFNVAAGYDTFNGNPLGRYTTLAISKKW
jgi:iron complex outermembrane receptor protein